MNTSTKEEKIKIAINSVTENLKTLGKSEEEIKTIVQDYIDTNYFEKLYDKHAKRIENLTNFSDIYKKIVFITTNEIVSNNVSDIEQLSVTIFYGQLTKDYKNNKCIDRFYYSNKNKKNKSFTTTKRKELKANYAKTFEEDKKYIAKLIGNLDSETLVVVFCKDKFAGGLDFLDVSECKVLDLYTDLSHLTESMKSGLIPILNMCKVNFDVERLQLAFFLNECLMRSLYYIVYYYDDALIDFKNKSLQKKNEINNNSINQLIDNLTKKENKHLAQNLYYSFMSDEARNKIKELIESNDIVEIQKILESQIDFLLK